MVKNKKLLLLLIIIFVIIETYSLSLFKYNDKKYIIIGILLYTLVAFALNYFIKIEGLAIGHALYDISTIILVTLVGIFYFKEKINLKKKIGLILAIISVILLL